MSAVLGVQWVINEKIFSEASHELKDAKVMKLQAIPFRCSKQIAGPRVIIPCLGNSKYTILTLAIKLGLRSDLG